MSNPILPLLEWPPGIQQASVPANENALRNEALSMPALGVANDESGPSDGDIWIVGDTPAGAFANFDEHDIALYRGGWHAWTPIEGVRLVVADVRKMFDGAEWIDDPAGGGPGAVDSVNGQTGAVQIDAEDAPYDNLASGLTATDVQGAIDELAAIGGVTKFVSVAMSDMTTDLTTGAAKAAWFAPEDGELQSVFIGVHDPSSSGVVRVDMNDSGGSVFTTRPAIDATEATSLTGTTAVLDGTVSFSRGDKFTFDIDDAGTDAKGLQVCVEYVPA